MVSEEKESRPFQTDRTDEAHCFFRLTESGNWPVGYFICGEEAKLLLPFFQWRCISESAPPALLFDLFIMEPEGNRHQLNLSCMMVNQVVYKLLIHRRCGDWLIRTLLCQQRKASLLHWVTSVYRLLHLYRTFHTDPFVSVPFRNKIFWLFFLC